VRASAALLVVVAVAVVAGAGCGGHDDAATAPLQSAGWSMHPVAGTFEPDGTRLSSCEGGFRCLEQAFGNVAFDRGPKAAIRLFELEMGRAKPVEEDCHRIAHTIGSASLARNHGDVAETFSEGSSICNSGYYHGILERAFVGATTTKELRRRAQTICDRRGIAVSRWLTFTCLHGLGHGLMIQSGYDLETALAICSGLRSNWDQEVCSGGSFMENFFSTYGVTSRFLRKDDLLYPCDSRLVVEEYKQSCYLIVTSRVLNANGYDWGATARLCATVRRSDLRATCFQSYGRDASGFTRHDPARIVALCGRTGRGQSDCIYGAARDLTAEDSAPGRAARLCRRAGRSFRERCFNGIGTIVGDVETTDEARARACRSVTTRFARACLDGAGVSRQ
jgi:hypothetical protein